MVNSKNSGFDLFVFFERTPDLVCIASKDGYFKKVNPAVIEKLGYTEEELFARPIASFIYDEDKHTTQKTRDAMLAGEALKNFENRYITKQGELYGLNGHPFISRKMRWCLLLPKMLPKGSRLKMKQQKSSKKLRGWQLILKAV